MSKLFRLSIVLGSFLLAYSINANPTFFTKPSMVGAQMSPDGLRVATVINQPDGKFLNIYDIETKQSKAFINVEQYAEDEANLGQVLWIDNQHIALEFILIKEGIESLISTKQSRKILVIDVSEEFTDAPTIKSIRTKGYIVNSLPKQANELLFSVTGAYSRLYKIDVRQLLPDNQKLNKLTRKDGGQFRRKNEVQSARGLVMQWFLDATGTPTAVLKYHLRDQIALFTFDENNEQSEEPLVSWNILEIFPEEEVEEEKPFYLPTALGPEPNTFYSFNINEDERKTVYLSDYSNDTHTPVLTTNGYKIFRLVFSDSNNQLIGVRVINDGQVTTEYINQSSQDIANNGQLDITLFEAPNNRSLVYKESHSQPGQYFIRNTNSGSEQLLGSTFPALDGQLSSTLVQDTLNIDGLNIPYFLSLPKQSNQPAPLIVMPHGGPFGIFDDQYFDLPTQYFVHNGYAVLRVNFRGSGGYSEEFIDAGKKEFGGKMLTDIIAVTNLVAQRAEINADKICASGGSYGGYASTMLILKEPNIYKCAVNLAGISDMGLFLNAPTWTKKQRRWGRLYIGNTKLEYDALKAISPLYMAEQFTRPIFIVHGVKDEVVDIEQAKRLIHALDYYGKDFKWATYPDMGHNFTDSKEASEVYFEILTFINEQLGLE